MKSLQDMTGKEVFINILEVRKPEIDAHSWRRTSRSSAPFRRAMSARCSRRCVSAPRDQGHGRGPPRRARDRPQRVVPRGRVLALRADIEYASPRPSIPTASSASRSGPSGDEGAPAEACRRGGREG
jgi:hypothetical protein